jgi:hypothetical protein
MRLLNVRRSLASTLLLSSVAGCGNVEPIKPDAAPPSGDAASPDASVDAMPDAMPTAAPVSTTNSGTVAEGAVLALTTRLVTTDADTAAGQLVYTVRAQPGHGALKRAGQTLAVGDTFTQQEVNDGVISYANDGAEAAADTFQWSLSDGSNVIPATGALSFAITVTPVNDVPVVVNNPSSTVAEGGSEVLTMSRLLVSDAEGSALTFTLLGTTRVQLQKNNVALAVNGTFTQQDVLNGILNVVDPGTDDALLQQKMPTSGSFTWKVTDAQGAVVPATGGITSSFTISAVDDPPSVTWRSQRCDTDGTDVPADPLSSLTDVDNAAGDYQICVVSITNGTSLISTPSVTYTTTVIPTLQNGTTVLTDGNCINAGARGSLNLDSTANQHRGWVEWRLIKNGVQIGGNVTVAFPLSPTSC